MSSTPIPLPPASNDDDPSRSKKVDRPNRHKAAAMLAMLDDFTLGSLAGRLPEKHRERLLNAVMELRSVPVEEQQRIALEFAHSFQKQKNAIRGNEETANRLVNSLYSEDDDDDGMPAFEPMDFSEMGIDDDDDFSQEETVWQQVAQLPSEKLTDFFTDKPPAVISIVLRQLSDEAASELTGALPEEVARQSMLQIAVAGEVNPLAVEAVENLLENELLKEEEDTDAAAKAENSAKIANILNRLTSTRREIILDALKDELTADDLTNIAAKVLSFEALEDRLPRNAIPILFREVPEKLLLACLKYGLDQKMPVAEYLLKNISQRMASQYREKMDAMPSASSEDGEKAQSAVICKVLEMAEDGRVKLLEVTSEKSPDDL